MYLRDYSLLHALLIILITSRYPPRIWAMRTGVRFMRADCWVLPALLHKRVMRLQIISALTGNMDHRVLGGIMPMKEMSRSALTVQIPGTIPSSSGEDMVWGQPITRIAAGFAGISMERLTNPSWNSDSVQSEPGMPVFMRIMLFQ